MTRVVSLTPSRVERDTRTFKEATSFARHGHESIVVEAAASELVAADLRFRLVREEPSPGPGGPGAQAAAAGEQDASELAANRAPGATAEPARAAYRRLPRPLRRRRRARPARAADARALPARRAPRGHRAARRRPLLACTATTSSRRPGWPPAATAPPSSTTRTTSTRRSSRAVRRPRSSGDVMRGFYLAVERACVRAAAQVLTGERRRGRPHRRSARAERPLVVRNCAELRGLREDGPDVRSAAGRGRTRPSSSSCPATTRPACVPSPRRSRRSPCCPSAPTSSFVGDGYAEIAAQVAPPRTRRPRAPAARDRGAVEVPAFIRTADAVAVLYLPTMPRDRVRSCPNGFFAAIAAGLPVLWPRATARDPTAGRGARAGRGDRARRARVHRRGRARAPRGPRAPAPRCAEQRAPRARRPQLGGRGARACSRSSRG